MLGAWQLNEGMMGPKTVGRCSDIVPDVKATKPWRRALAALVFLLATCGAAFGADGAGTASSAPMKPDSVAFVVIDGRDLFRVAGASALPADKRSRAISARIEAVAASPEISADAVRQEAAADHIKILADKSVLLEVYDFDARLEGVDSRLIAARVIADRIRQAILDYREERAENYLLKNGIVALIVTVVMSLVLWGLRRALVRTVGYMERRYRERLHGLRIQSFEIMQADQLWGLVRALTQFAWWLLAFVLAYFYLERVLSRFPWTRGFANWLLELVFEQVRTMGNAVLGAIPGLVFIAILIIFVRYILKLTRLFFLSVAQGSVNLSGFEPEWAIPTYSLIRFAIVAFAAVVAFPYVPGSGSDAFKGVSVFVGVLFSIGSSSIISNVLAGYNLIFRRAFRVGDRVMIGKYVGDVVAVRQQVTQLRTPKNEQVVIPNSMILLGEIVNYSNIAHEGRLVLHTSVTIGYDTPWRQVEAMLLEAARRTPGLPPEPAPFVLKTSLGDFYIEYEINVYCNEAQAMPRLYSALHENIVDVFNEHGVQIMSPHFIAQPDQAVVVPKDQWYAAPARTPGERNAGS